jgi:hypothetical protein
LRSLNLAVWDWERLGPYSVLIEDKPQGGWHPIKLLIRHDPPDTLGIEIGEFFCSLRSALDQLAWQLALQTTDTPIFAKKPTGHTRLEQQWKRQTKDILPSALDIIERLQPYYRGDWAGSDPLWVVHDTCNIDKHHAITPLVMAVGESSLNDLKTRPDYAVTVHNLLI